MHVRMAPAVPGRLGVALVAGALLLGCGPPRSTDDVRVQWALDPAAPSASIDTIARITVHDERRQPVTGARLQLEAHMSHPGMAPVVGRFTDRGGGAYDTRLQFSMAGDWVLVVTGELPDGRRITRSLPVAGVRPAGERPPLIW